MFKKRCVLFVVSVFALLSLLLVRFFCLGVIQNSSYLSLAFAQQTAVRTVSRVRGNIYDRNMIPFTGSDMVMQYIGEGGEVQSQKTDFGFENTLRYGKEPAAAHILGYAPGGEAGVCAIEKEFDAILSSDQTETVSYFSDALGSPVGDVRKNPAKGTSGSVVLTLDSHIQKCVEDVMDGYITRGAAVVIDIETFDILACVSRPDYNPNTPAIYLGSDGGELMNRALLPYNAGSVFKIVTAAASLENNTSYKNRFFYCSGKFSPGASEEFLCHKADGHGLLFMPDAFAQSCNSAFYETGLCTGGDEICTMARRLGLGKKVLGIDMGESGGNIPDRAVFSELETVNLSIGQGEILITPLQCTQMTAIIASGGVKRNVNLLKSVTDKEGNIIENLYSSSEEQVINSSTAMITGAMMRETVLSGTASAAADCGVSIAGKTGSAETGWQNPDGSLKVHGWFCGYFPYENPKYAVTVFCEDGKSGAQSCVAPFVEIAEGIGRIYPFEN